jgi:hypothetical protein
VVLSFSEQDESDGFDDFSYVDAFGAAGVTGQAGSTDPDGF